MPIDLCLVNLHYSLLIFGPNFGFKFGKLKRLWLVGIELWNRTTVFATFEELERIESTGKKSF